MDHVEEFDRYLLVTIVAWLAVRTEAKYFSGTRAFHGNGLINWKVKFVKDEKKATSVRTTPCSHDLEWRCHQKPH